MRGQKGAAEWEIGFHSSSTMSKRSRHCPTNVRAEVVFQLKTVHAAFANGYHKNLGSRNSKKLVNESIATHFPSDVLCSALRQHMPPRIFPTQGHSGQPICVDQNIS